MNKRLQDVVNQLDMIRQLYDKEVIISVIDKDKIVRGFSLPKGIPPQVKVGSVFEDPSGVFDEVIAEGITKHNFLPKEVMGFPVEGNLVPIKDNGQVVGCVICSYSVEDREMVEDIAVIICANAPFKIFFHFIKGQRFIWFIAAVHCRITKQLIS